MLQWRVCYLTMIFFPVFVFFFPLLWAIMLDMLMGLLLDRNLTTIAQGPAVNLGGLNTAARLATGASLWLRTYLSVRWTCV